MTNPSLPAAFGGGGGTPHGTAPFGSQHAHLPAVIAWPPSPITYQGATGALRTQ